MTGTFSWRVLSVVGALLLSAGLGTAAAEPREQRRAEQPAWSALSTFGDTLIAIWSDVGGSLDPFGKEKPTSTVGDALIAIWSDVGASLDPFGKEKPTGQSGSGGVAPAPERE